MRYVLLLSVTLFCATAREAIAGLVKVRFAGTVTVATSPPFGISVGAFSPVTGGFSYDPNTTPVTVANTSTYRQHLASGFFADIGATHVSTDSYDLTVSDNLLQPNSTLADVVTIIFASNSNPPPDSPLMVAGTQQSIGKFSINLIGGSSLYSSTSLPVSPRSSDFSTKLGFFADTPTGVVDVFFTLSSLQAVPEPSGRVLLALGILVIGFWRARTKSR